MRAHTRLLAGLALAGTASLTLGGCGWLAEERFEDDATVSDKVTSVRLDSKNGEVVLRGKEGLKEISVHREVAYRGARPSVSHQVRDGVLELRACGNRCHVRYVVDLPAGLPVSGRSANGAIELSKVGRTEVGTSNGRVLLRDIGADVEVRTSNGEVEGHGLRGGRIDVSSANGSVELAAPGARDLRVSTANGSIELTVPDGAYAVDARSKNGSKEIGVTSDPGAQRKLTLTSANGGIVVKTG